MSGQSKNTLYDPFTIQMCEVTLPSLNWDTIIDANCILVKNQRLKIDPDEMTHDYSVCISIYFGLEGWKG